MKNPVIIYIISILLATSILIAFGISLGTISPPQSIETSANETKYSTVIIDAGHGGEDGGASSKNGLIEKNINLELAMMLRDLLSSKDINVVLTRDTDTLLYDRSADYKGKKKKLDMEARLKIIQNTDNCIFVSLHMNSFSDSRYSGLQVWYSDNNADSQTLANLVQTNIQSELQPDNNRKIKSAGDDIYLLSNSHCPSILVECGFLSNIAEADLFRDAQYKQSLTSNLCDSIINFLETCHPDANNQTNSTDNSQYSEN